jgi:hypothetical protein
LALALLLLCTPAAALAPELASAQASEPPYTTEPVFYRNAQDSTYLTATLALPAGPGPHPGVVLLSIAGTDPLVDHLAGRGYAVLSPARRGFVSVEPLLRATYADLAGDARAAVDYLGARPEIDEAALGLIGQADDAPAAMLAADASADPIPLVLLAPPGFPGREVFRLEQLGLAEGRGVAMEELVALERHVDEIASIVLNEDSPAQRASRLQLLMATSDVGLPYNAAFPNDEGQARFLASPLWHDRMAFDPEAVLAGLHAPVLVLIGTEDPNTPMEAYLAAMRRGLSGAPTTDSAVCRIDGRTRHSFTGEAVETIARWLDGRLAGSADASFGGMTVVCF